MGALAAEAERAPREQEAERRGRVVDAVDVRLRRSESCVGASVELRLRASARTCGDRGCAERRRWRRRDDDTGARAAPHRRKKREAHRGKMCCCRDQVLAVEAGAGGTRSRTLTVDASGGGCSEVPARRRR